MPFWNRKSSTDDQVRELLAKGHEYMHQQQPDTALPLFEQCTGLQPNNGVAWASLGQALLDVQRLPEAIATLDRALRLDSNSVASWYNQALAYRRLGAFEQAEAAVEQALRLNPKAWLAWYEKGLILCHDTKPEQIESIDQQHLAAFEAFSQAVALRPGDLAAWLWRGRLGWRIGLSMQVRERAGMTIEPSAQFYCDAAIASFDQVLTLVPDDPATLFDKGRTLVDFDFHAEAREVYRRLTAVADHPNDWYQLALVDDELGDAAELRASLARALALDPDLRSRAIDDFAAYRNDPAFQELLG